MLSWQPKIKNVLDVTMSPTTGEYEPYMKPSNIPLYIFKESYHYKSIPGNISKKIIRNRKERSSLKVGRDYQILL